MNPSEQSNVPEITEAELREEELHQMQKEILRAMESSDFDIHRLELRLVLTPHEHFGIGSSSEGRAYHADEPLALVGGIPLDVINARRKEIENQKYFVYFDDRAVYLRVRLLPLADGVGPTYEIVGAEEISAGKKEVPVTNEIRERFAENWQNAQKAAREELLVAINAS